MGLANLRREERYGLGIAVAAHVALAAALLMQPATREQAPKQERMTVNLASEVSPVTAAPDPVAQSRAGEAPAVDPEPAPMVQPAPAEQPEQPPQPAPRPAPPKPIERTLPAPAPKPLAKPAPQPVARPATRPVPTPAMPVAAKPAPAKAAPSRPASVKPAPSKPAASVSQPAKKPAGSRIGADFLPGSGDAKAVRETRVPASQIGASAKASLVQAISRKLKPKWQPPDGPEVDAITTYLRFRLNPDGSLAARPEMVRQTGVNAVNRSQAARHAEQAIRAVQLAAPFDLPDEYYEAWKLVGPFGFDWKLAQ